MFTKREQMNFINNANQHIINSLSPYAPWCQMVNPIKESTNYLEPARYQLGIVYQFIGLSRANQSTAESRSIQVDTIVSAKIIQMHDYNHP